MPALAVAECAAVRDIDPITAARALALAREGLARPGAPLALPARLLVVDAERQIAILIEDEEPVAYVDGEPIGCRTMRTGAVFRKAANWLTE